MCDWLTEKLKVPCAPSTDTENASAKERLHDDVCEYSGECEYRVAVRGAPGARYLCQIFSSFFKRETTMATSASQQGVTVDDGPESLMTRKALVASLSPPRAPPIGSAHRHLLGGRNPSKAHWEKVNRLYHPPHRHRYDESTAIDSREAQGHRPHRTFLQRLQERLSKSRYEFPRHPHPHLPIGPPEVEDQITRLLGVLLPLSWQNQFRDSGRFRAVADTLTVASIPILAVMQPAQTMNFLKLGSRVKRIKYDKHPMQIMELFLPEESNTDQQHYTRTIFFVHGGAWGSGFPWLYRLVAMPFLQHGMAVAIVGYRTYPDATSVKDIIQDCHAAFRCLERIHPRNCKYVTLVGHSSGAHVGAMMLIEQARLAMTQIDPGAARFDSFIGMSGPYDISHHFDYEASRGVEEISPLKPVCGYSRHEFWRNSPGHQLRHSLVHFNEQTVENNYLPNFDKTSIWTTPSHALPDMCLIHGIEDGTVPFTSTAEFASILRACGVPSSRISEVYIAETSHQDVVMQLMLGGRTQTAVMDWLKGVSLRKSKEKETPTVVPPMRQLLAQSKL